jgi:protein-tyrosine-phosphatase
LASLGGPESGLAVRSAGLIGPGRPSPENAQSAARKLGLDLGDHRSAVVTREMTRWSELVVVMDAGQSRIMRTQFGADRARIVVLGDLDPIVPDRREIPDPVERPESEFLKSYERMDRCLHELFHLINA